MAKTYTLTGTLNTGGYNGYSSNYWTSFWQADDTHLGKVGRNGSSSSSRSHATNILFNATTLAELRTKTVTAMSLVINITETLNTGFYPSYKLNGSSTDWTRSDADSTAASADYIKRIVTNVAGPMTIDMTGYKVPKYGITMGPAMADNDWFRFNSATLYVTTNETDYTYTLSYNLVGGSNGPANQNGSNTQVSPSYTFTVSDTIPTRTGYTFSGWSTTSGGSVEYTAGDSYTVTSTTATLYAVWTKNSYTIKINCLDPENAVSATAAYFDVWYSDDQTVQTNKTSLSVSKQYGDTVYISNIRPYYSYFTVTSVSGMTSDGNGQYHYTLDENAANHAMTINTARVQYAVTYNANGGSGAPAAQTKYGGVSLTLSNTIPTRNGYTFVKWNTASDGTGTDYNPSATYTANAALTLYAIWVASSSTITLANYTCEAGSSVLVYINKISATATHTITYSIGSKSGTIATKTSADEVTFSVPENVVSEIPGASGTCTVSCVTYINNAQSGVAQTAELIVTVPASYQPTVGITVAKVNSNSTVEGWDILLQGYSQVQVTATSVMASGATFVSYSFSGPGVSYIGTNNQVTSSVIDVYGRLPWAVTVTDSRGRTATVAWDYAAFEIYAYQNPSISSAVSQRTDSTGAASTGNFMKSKARFTISSANGHNNISVHKVEYKASTASTWVLGDDNMASDTWTSPYGSGTLNVSYAYDIRYTLTDTLGNTAQVTASVSAVVGVGIGLKNDRLRLGGLPTKAGLVVDWASEFNGAATFKSTMDITPRRVTAALTSAGWYRVFKYGASSETNAKAGVSFVIDMTISEASREAHKITLFGTYTSIVFGNEVSHGVSSYIDKVRYTHNGANAYIDIHWTGATSSRYAMCYFDVKCRNIDYHSRFTTQSYTSKGTGDTPSGETVIATYTFAQNTPEVSYNTSTNYHMFPDGTMIQWGIKDGVDFSAEKIKTGTITMPKSFANTTYTVVITSLKTAYNEYALRTGALANTVNTFDWTLASGDSTDITITGRGFGWIAIGRWK